MANCGLRTRTNKTSQDRLSETEVPSRLILLWTQGSQDCGKMGGRPGSLGTPRETCLPHENVSCQGAIHRGLEEALKAKGLGSPQPDPGPLYVLPMCPSQQMHLTSSSHCPAAASSADGRILLLPILALLSGNFLWEGLETSVSSSLPLAPPPPPLAWLSKSPSGDTRPFL